MSKRNRSGAEQKRARKRRLEREALWGTRPGVEVVHSTYSNHMNTNIPKETAMSIQIEGDGTPNTSHGTAEVWVECDTVNVSLPDRFGNAGGVVNLTFGDAATLVAELNRLLAAPNPAQR